MKKIIILLFIILFCTGCFNYVEINDLVLINGIGIDYKDNKYIVSFETLQQNKEHSDSNFEWGEVTVTNADSISDAFNKLSLKLVKNPYYAHLKVIVISKEIASNHFSDLLDYFLRNNDIRNIFYLVVSDNITPKELLNSKNKYYPTSSERIKELIENNEYNNFIVNNSYFKDIASNYLTKNKDIYLTMIGLEDNNMLINRMFIVGSNNKYLDINQSSILSILTNSKPNILIKHECEKDKYFTIKIYDSKSKYYINKSQFNIVSNLNAEIVENNCNINLESNTEYNNITDIFNKKIDKEYKNLFDYLKEINSDLIGINKKYFNKYRTRDYDYFKNSKYSVKTNIQLNKKGLIFEVKHND